jgi:hypothetical protein
VVDDMAVLTQALGDVVGGLLVVFDEEDFHFSPDSACGIGVCLDSGPNATFPNYTNIQ